MLGLGASHLNLRIPKKFNTQALAHRSRAISSLNSVLSKQNITQAEGDAAFATVLALTFQSSYLPDGMVDFITMVRGC
jgi:hypothetical protein